MLLVRFWDRECSRHADHRVLHFVKPINKVKLGLHGIACPTEHSH